MKLTTLSAVAIALGIVVVLTFSPGAIAESAPTDKPDAVDVEAPSFALPDYVTSPVAETKSTACSARFDYERNFWQEMKPAPDFSEEDSNDSIVDTEEERRKIAENRLQKLEQWEANGSCWKGLQP